MIAAALRHSARAALFATVRNPIGRVGAGNPAKCPLPQHSAPVRRLVSAPPARRMSLTTKLGFFCFMSLFLLVPELAMVVAIPNHAGTSIEAIKRKMEEEAAAEEEAEQADSS